MGMVPSTSLSGTSPGSTTAPRFTNCSGHRDSILVYALTYYGNENGSLNSSETLADLAETS